MLRSQFHNLLPDLVRHIQLFQVFENACAAGLLIEEIVLPLLSRMLGECLSQCVAIKAVELANSALIYNVDLCCRWNQENRAAAFCHSRVVTQFTLLFFVSWSKEAHLRLEIQRTWLTIAAAILHL